MVSALNINVTTGALTVASNTAVATGTNPFALVFTPAGDAAFISNSTSNDVARYTIGTNGALATVSGNQAAGASPHGMAIDAGGHFLFLANQGDSTDPASGTVSAYSIATGAALTEVSGSPFPSDNTGTAGPGPVAVAVTPDGKYLYVANQFANTVSAFSVDTASGVLTKVLGSPYPVGTSPSSLAVSPNGNFLYVVNSGSNNVTVFAVCDNASPNCPSPDGSLTEISDSPFSAGLGPVHIAISKTGNFAYVVDQNSNQLSGYKLNLAAGTMTATTPVAATSTGVHPSWVAISSGEQFVYVANNGSSTVSAFTMDANSGQLTVVGTPLAVGPQPSSISF
jgi:YVTN family beta-propeller protein